MSIIASLFFVLVAEGCIPHEPYSKWFDVSTPHIWAPPTISITTRWLSSGYLSWLERFFRIHKQNYFLSRHAGIAKIVSNSCLYSVMVRINQHVAKYIWIPFFYRYMEHHSESFAIDPLDKNKSCIGSAKSPKNSSWAGWSQQRRSPGSKRNPFPNGLLIRMVFILNSKLKHKSLDTTWNE